MLPHSFRIYRYRRGRERERERERGGGGRRRRTGNEEHQSDAHLKQSLASKQSWLQFKLKLNPKLF